MHALYRLGACLLALQLALPLGDSAAQTAPRWHERYRPIDDEGAHELVRLGFERARALLGEPRLSVRRVHLRLSEPLDRERGLRSGFRLTELVSAADGEFAIYLSRAPGEYAFEGQLAHEIAHLLNAQLHDVYAEGLATVFAERLLRETGRDWEGWERHFRAGGDPLYARSYLMMREVWAAAGDAAVRRLLSFARRSGPGPSMHLDVPAWLATLPDPMRKRVERAIRRHAAEVEAEVRRAGGGLAFRRP